MGGADEPTGVAKDQKHTPKKPYNTDMAIYKQLGPGGWRVSRNTYDSRIVADEVPNE